MINSLDEAILNLGNGKNNKHSPSATLYSSWSHDYAATIQTFYDDFIADRLPDPHIVLRWHNVLVAYAGRAGAIFPVRLGNVTGALRRGWLVNVDDDFSYMFSDNDLASYIYKMALDGYCPKEDEFFEFMTVFKAPADIKWCCSKGIPVRNHTYGGCQRHFLSMPVHFNHIGGKSYPDNTEAVKNAFINYSPAPTCCLGRYGYKHAHLVDVNKAEYDGCASWKDVGPGLLGEESTRQQDYQFDPTIQNFVWKRTDLTANEKAELKKLLTAHLFRFLDPMNHFLAPQSNNNRFILPDGSTKNDVAEYINLQKYIIERKTAVFGTAYDDFLIRACAPASLRSSSVSGLGSEAFQLRYYQKKKAARTAVRKFTATSRTSAGKNKETVFRIFNNIIGSGKMTPTLLAELQTLSFAQNNFRISSYPILVETSTAGSHPNYNRKKYYQPETITINAKHYHLCSQWIPERIALLENWYHSL